MSLIKVKSRGTDNVSGRKNLIINGAMQVFQRSPVTGIGDPSVYTLDRWYMGREASGQSARFTVTQENLSSSDAPRTTDGLSTTMKIDVTTASGGISAGQSHYLMQRIEGQNIHQLNYGSSDGKTCTVSFWLKTDTKTGTMCVSAYHGGNKNYIQEISATTSWTKYTLQIPADTATSFDNNTSNGFQLMFVLSGGSNLQATKDQWNSGFDNCTSNQADFTDSTSNNIYLTGIQLEVGSSASDFEHRSFGEELALCQRYYFNPWLGTGSRGYQISGFRHPSGWIFSLLFPNTMRAAPTITFTGSPDNSIGINSTGGGVSARPTAEFSSSSISKYGCRLLSSWTGTYSTGDPGALTNDQNTATMNIDAEL